MPLPNYNSRGIVSVPKGKLNSFLINMNGLNIIPRWLGDRKYRVSTGE